MHCQYLFCETVLSVCYAFLKTKNDRSTSTNIVEAQLIQFLNFLLNKILFLNICFNFNMQQKLASVLKYYSL